MKGGETLEQSSIVESRRYSECKTFLSIGDEMMKAKTSLLAVSLGLLMLNLIHPSVSVAQQPLSVDEELEETEETEETEELAVDPQALSQGFCFIDLERNSIENQAPGAVSVVVPPLNHRAVVKLTLRASTSGFTRARIHVAYGATFVATSTNWTVNIGDSATNNGGSGDAATQSNDAEAQILGDVLTVFGKDGTFPPNILTVSNVVANGRTIVFEIRNNYFAWDGNELRSDRLYALAGQADTEGSVNYDVYAAFNRVISGSRQGSGVRWVLIELFRS
jgi:hypothetical protein